MSENNPILLFEDNPSQALYLQTILQRGGYQVQVAHDGGDGWRMARTARPRLILLDVGLPTLDGFQVLKRLKHDQATAGIPVIMLTAADEPDAVARALAMGADDYLCKDDAGQQLCAVVRQLLESLR
jgi:DNA-binding response OmpR family regulator